jgi:hypothetical protein
MGVIIRTTMRHPSTGKIVRADMRLLAVTEVILSMLLRSRFAQMDIDPPTACISPP